MCNPAGVLSRLGSHLIHVTVLTIWDMLDNHGPEWFVNCLGLFEAVVGSQHFAKGVEEQADDLPHSACELSVH